MNPRMSGKTGKRTLSVGIVAVAVTFGPNTSGPLTGSLYNGAWSFCGG